MNPPLPTLLHREQRAFLRRDRSHWAGHLGQIRGFLGEGLRTAQQDAPILILGAGSGLEIPWKEAPAATVGWDADPWSRLRTWLRHGRWVPWVFEDLTGSFEGLDQLLARTVRQPWSGQRRNPEVAIARLAGLLPSLQPDAASLRAWIEQHRPGTILAANVLGQLGVLAQGLVEGAFAPWLPWEEDAEQRDALGEALDGWVARVLGAVLTELRNSGADLWLVHDRGVIHGPGPVELGAAAEPWTAQLLSTADLELSDPLCSLDLRRELPVERLERWLWPVGEGQIHLMEAVFSPCPR